MAFLWTDAGEKASGARVLRGSVKGEGPGPGMCSPKECRFKIFEKPQIGGLV